jgi:AcrR family transcriptional regulator
MNESRSSLSSQRRERERVELRKKLIDAARDLFVEHGYGAVTLRKVAEAVEYSPAAIYQHFKDKDALILAICLEDYRSLTAALLAHAQIGDPLLRLRAYLRAYVDWALANPRAYHFMMMVTLPAEASRAFTAAWDAALPTDELRAALDDCIRELIARGSLRDLGAIDLATETFWAGIHGLVAFEITFGSAPDEQCAPLDRRIETMIDVLIAGMSVREG